uniref:Aldehyde reductase-3 n=1 Tax=Plutella xylostella TaxID=51655 RepID=A0A1L8D6X2_PLUXY
MGVFEARDKVFVVTGAAGGIGAGVVRAFLEEGAKHVAILDVAEEAGKEFEKELLQKYGSDKAKFFKCDVTNDDQLYTAFEETKKNYGLNTVINNAAIMNDSFRSYKKQIEINVTAVITSTLKAIDIMRKDKGGNGGTVINISSIAGLSQSHFLPIYFATKSAVIQFSNCIGMEPNYKVTGVRVVTVCFGVTDTSLLHVQKIGTIDDDRTGEFNTAVDHAYKQKLESAVNGVVAAYKAGASASTWLANRDRPPVDITQDVKDAYTVMSTQMALAVKEAQ